MNNRSIKISEEILKEFDGLIKKSGVSQQEFLNSIANIYNMNSILDKNVIDPAAYYDSFIA